MGIAIRVLSKLNVRRGPGYDECRSEAMLALCRAAQSFDPVKAGFSTWAWLKVSGAVKDWLDREARQSRLVLCDPDTEHDSDRELVCPQPSPDEQVYDRQVVAAVAACVPAHGRQLAACVVFNEMTARECAKVGHVSLSTAERQRSEIRKSLAMFIKCDLDLDEKLSA